MDLATLLSQARQAGGLNTVQLADAVDAIDAEFDAVTAKPETAGRTLLMGDLVSARQLLGEEAERRGLPLTASAGIRGRVGGQVSRMAALSGRAESSPERRSRAAAGASSVVITASASAPGIAPGQVLQDPDELAQVMAEQLRRSRHDPMPGLRHVCASARWSYPDHRVLDSDDPLVNSRKIETVCGPRAPRVNRRTGALTASGGICLPTNVDYSVPVWSTADRPLRDNLPAFQVPRGGLQYVAPPDIGIPSLQGTASGPGEATTVWSEATDADPAGNTKPVWQVACGTPEQVYVNAIATRVEFGNMQSRFAPEQVAANTEQAIATAAREAELELLTLMYSYSKQVLPEKYLGAARDLLASADLLVEQYRHSHRIPETAAMTAVFPAWVKGLIRADLARELAHDNSNGRDVLGVTNEMIEDYFDARGISVIWTLDGLAAGTYGTGGNELPNQFFRGSRHECGSNLGNTSSLMR